MMFDYLSGGKLKWAPMDDEYDRFYVGGRTFCAKAGKQQFRDKSQLPVAKDKTQAKAGGNPKTMHATTPAEAPAQLAAAPAPDAPARSSRRMVLENCSVGELDLVRHPSGKFALVDEVDTNFLSFRCLTVSRITCTRTSSTGHVSFAITNVG